MDVLRAEHCTAGRPAGALAVPAGPARSGVPAACGRRAAARAARGRRHAGSLDGAVFFMLGTVFNVEAGDGSRACWPGGAMSDAT